MQIDHTNAIIYGVCAAMNVEAIGHGICCDRQSLELTATLANQKAKGVAGRFGHPAFSENATGRKVQMATNWRVEDRGTYSYLLHDSHLLDAARTSPAFAQDPVAYILRIAAQQPDQFAE